MNDVRYEINCKTMKNAGYDHTPEPWYVVHESEVVSPSEGHSEADARLIAAAPELLRFVELFVAYKDRENIGPFTLEDLVSLARGTLLKAIEKTEE